MGRPAVYRTALLADLRRQLAFASADALHREIEASEALLDALDPETEYPPEFVLFRITGYRSDRVVGANEGERLRGADLRADIALLVLELSERAPLDVDARPGGAATLAEVARSLSVATRTLHRWRRAGLVTHRVRLADGRVATAIFADRLRRFREQEPGLVERAARFTRVDEATRARIAEAVRTRVDQGAQSEASAAAEVAAAFGVSPETARQIARGARGAAALASGARARVRERERCFVHRSSRFSIDAKRIAKRIDRTADAVRRIDRSARASMLWAFADAEGPLPPVDPAWRADLLASGRELIDVVVPGDPADSIVVAWELGSCLARARARAAVDAGALERLAAAARAARWSAIETLRASSPGNGPEQPTGASAQARARVPSVARLDPVETLMRESVVYRRRAAERLFSRAVSRVDRVLGEPLEARSAVEARLLVRECVEAIEVVLDRFRPVRARAAGEREARAGMLERRLHLEIDRRLARGRWSSDRGRATPRATPIDDPLLRFEEERRRIDPVRAWHRRRTCDLAFPGRPADLDADLALLDARFGWNGTRPRTLEELAGSESIAGVTRRVESAVARLLAAR